jgi:hypothetical protein
LLPYPGASSAPGRKRKNPDTKGGWEYADNVVTDTQGVALQISGWEAEGYKTLIFKTLYYELYYTDLPKSQLT